MFIFRILIATIFAASATTVQGAVLVSYNFNTTPNPTGGIISANATSFTPVGGAIQANASGRLRISQQVTDLTPPADPTLAIYTGFTLDSDPGCFLDLSQLSFGVRRQAAGRDATLIIRSSNDGFLSNIYSQHINDENSAVDQFINLSSFESTSSIEFRFYVVKSTSGGLIKRLELEGLSVDGVQIPEPASIAVLGGLGLCFAGSSLSRRRKKA